MRQLLLGINDEFLTVNQILSRDHYLGPIRRGFPYRDEFGVMVFANPSSRLLPQFSWLELVRWCLIGERNGGSRQWSRVARWLRSEHSGVTTIVSYSDPVQGHTGALYRACGWLWAPTWHRLREPPTGNGDWGNGTRQSVKDRWIFCLRPDDSREQLLRIQDESLRNRYAWAEYREGMGGDFRQWRSLQTAMDAEGPRNSLKRSKKEAE